jgi:hypothetical protein
MLHCSTLMKVTTAVFQECGEEKYRFRLINFLSPPHVGVAAIMIGSSALALHTNRASWFGNWCAGVVRGAYRSAAGVFPRTTKVWFAGRVRLSMCYRNVTFCGCVVSQQKMDSEHWPHSCVSVCLLLP